MASSNRPPAVPVNGNMNDSISTRTTSQCSFFMTVGQVRQAPPSILSPAFCLSHSFRLLSNWFKITGTKW